MINFSNPKKAASAVLLAFFALSLTACSSAYYSAMEKVGKHKRDILVERVETAQESQEDAQEQFKSALEQLQTLIAFDGGDLAEQYELTKSQYEASLDAAQDVDKRINAVEDVADALFDEWRDEIDEYSSAQLRRQSQQKLETTQRQYQRLAKAMHRARDKMDPVLASLKDNMLYLKHNLNASAVGAIKGEYNTIKKDIELLIKQMNDSIKQSQTFIDLLKS